MGSLRQGVSIELFNERGAEYLPGYLGIEMLELKLNSRAITWAPSRKAALPASPRRSTWDARPRSGMQWSPMRPTGARSPCSAVLR